MILTGLVAFAAAGLVASEPGEDAKRSDPPFRIVRPPSRTPVRTVASDAAVSVASASFNIESAAQIARAWGTVTSTFRSPRHNRRVGGARNSYHLRNRAIDIARRPGVSHRQIDAAYRGAGYLLIESLDEGDHSHFAFATGRVTPGGPVVETLTENNAGTSGFRIVVAPRPGN